MSILNLGKVRPVLLGAYSEATEYKFLNGVSYNGSYYFYINETASTGNLPTDTEYWAIAAQKGDKGDLGASIVTAAFVDDDMVFTLDDDTTVTLVGAKTALKGDKGDMGTIYTPELSAEGVLSFTNDGELDNPTPVDLTGPQGNPAPNTIFQYSINGTDWTDVATDAQWYRQSGDNGTTWSEAIELPSVEALALKAAAETAAGNAASSETAAQRAQAGAGTAQTGAETARTGAETARASAERAEGAAETARDAASVSEANAQRTYFNVAQLALQLGNPLLALENQNTLAEAILQENLLINNIYDRLEGGIYAAI